MRNQSQGFTLIELMIVVTVIAILASIAVPNLMNARLVANESAAIATLKTISAAQAQCQGSKDIDVDADGSGEFGFLAELSALIAIRTVTGLPGTDRVSPKLLTVTEGISVQLLGGTLTDAGAMRRSGYNFTVFLPSATGDFIPEDKGGGASAAHNPNTITSAMLWCCYAWPSVYGLSGKRVFFINQSGDVLAARNISATTRYGGAARGPNPNAAFEIGIATVTMGSSLAVFTSGKDNQIWTTVN